MIITESINTFDVSVGYSDWLLSMRLSKCAICVGCFNKILEDRTYAAAGVCLWKQ